MEVVASQNTYAWNSSKTHLLRRKTPGPDTDSWIKEEAFGREGSRLEHPVWQDLKGTRKEGAHAPSRKAHAVTLPPNQTRPMEGLRLQHRARVERR